MCHSAALLSTRSDRLLGCNYLSVVMNLYIHVVAPVRCSRTSWTAISWAGQSIDVSFSYEPALWTHSTPFALLSQCLCTSSSYSVWIWIGLWWWLATVCKSSASSKASTSDHGIQLPPIQAPGPGCVFKALSLNLYLVDIVGWFSLLLLRSSDVICWIWFSVLVGIDMASYECCSAFFAWSSNAPLVLCPCLVGVF